MYKYYKLPLIRMESFIYYSKKVGSNFLLCQGPGGNTSIKTKDHIYVKKSGKLLENSNKNMFKKINLKNITNFYEIPREDKKYEKSLSIETPFHVLLKNKYVFHYHSLASIILSAIFPEEEFDKDLIKNNILPIKYFRPGENLAREMIDLNKDQRTNVYFLRNHGVVIKGDNVSKIYSQINNLEQFFGNYIDYDKLKKIKVEILNLKIENQKIKNLNPDLNYEIFNDKFLFPDHSVFIPYNFKKLKNKLDVKFINFDEDYIYLNKPINKTTEIYFKSLIIIYSLIKDKKIKNYISRDIGTKLRQSDDEQLRIKLNK